MKSFFKQLKIVVLFVTMAALLAGCESALETPLYKQTLKQTQATQQRIAQAKMRDMRVPAATSGTVKTTDIFHQGGNPAWLNNHVTLRGNGLPLNVLMARLLPKTVIAQYQPSVNENQPIQLNYSGSIRGALDRVAAQINAAYNIEGGIVSWSGFVTKTFDISFMPGAAQYLMGGQAQVNAATSSSSSNGVATGINSQDSQYSNLQGTLSVWSDLQNSIKNMLSPSGKVMVSQATTTITVRDRPQNVQVIADYLASMNKDLSREVLLKVRVLEVNLNKSYNYGIDWNAVYNAYGSGGLSTGDLSQSVSGVAPLGANTPLGPAGAIGTAVGAVGSQLPIPGISAGILRGPFANSQLLINALSQQGEVSTVTNPQVMTLNNQVAQIEITRQTTYVASTTSTVTGVSGAAQLGVNPGVISTGFTLYVLPKIEGKNIYLQLTSDLSTLDSLGVFKESQTTGTGDDAATSTTSIELPVVSGKHFNIRSMVRSGDTLIIAGFRQLNNQTGKSSLFGISLFGGDSAAKSNVETIILITPVLAGHM